MDNRNTSVTVLVGYAKHPFHLDEQRLCTHSPFFLSTLRSGFMETQERVVLLPEVDAETFRVFERWLSNTRVSGFEYLDWALLCKFYVLADYLQISSVQNPILHALALKPKKVNKCVPLSAIPYIYENTMPRSPLRKLWVDWVVKYANPEVFDGDRGFPEEFLRELATAQLQYRNKLAGELKLARRV